MAALRSFAGLAEAPDGFVARGFFLVPLTVRQIHSMQSMQAHAPEMKEIQKKYKGDRQKLNEELMKFYKENNINPAASCLPLLAQLPVFFALYFVAQALHEAHPTRARWLAHRPEHRRPRRTSHWSGYLLLAIYAGSPDRCRRTSCGTTMDKTQRDIMMVAPAVFITVVARFPTGLVLYWVTTNLWTVGQGLITRRLVPKTPAPAIAAARRAGAEAQLAAARRRRRRTAPSCAERRSRSRRRRAAAPRQAEEGRRAAVSDRGHPVEATGETVGEAKWKALRELERLAPRSTRRAVRFQVVSEGERGLLGVGYTPARVVATVDGGRRRRAGAEPRRRERLAARVRELARARRRRARDRLHGSTSRETDEEIIASRAPAATSGC